MNRDQYKSNGRMGGSLHSSLLKTNLYILSFLNSGSADAESIIGVVCHFVACFGGLSLSRFLNKFGGALAHYRMDLGSARISGV